jgi:hypothetical protein
MKGEVTLILHTCDSYSFCWESYFHYIHKHFKVDIDKVFCTEETIVNQEGWSNLRTGKGEWSDRLIRILGDIKTPYVLYMQEDFWPIKDLDPEIVSKCLELMKRDKLSAFYITKSTSTRPEDGILKCYDEFKGNKMFRFMPNSPYIMNHQFALWDKLELLKNMVSNESPWQNEIRATRRIIERKEHENYKVMSHQWYEAVVRRGKFTEDGQRLKI